MCVVWVALNFGKGQRVMALCNRSFVAIILRLLAEPPAASLSLSHSHSEPWGGFIPCCFPLFTPFPLHTNDQNLCICVVCLPRSKQKTIYVESIPLIGQAAATNEWSNRRTSPQPLSTNALGSRARLFSHIAQRTRGGR
jgi:hypothetical protein